MRGQKKYEAMNMPTKPQPNKPMTPVVKNNKSGKGKGKGKRGC